jgi:hypothetical protein
MGKTKSRRHQKLYKMKGCSKKNHKHYLGGSKLVGADVNLAYPGTNVHSVANPALAYTGKDPYSFLHKGGANLGTIMPATVIPTNIPTNLNGANPTQPNTGPPQLPQGSVPQMNPVNPQRGGSCASLMQGGSCPSCAHPLMQGGSCSTCSLMKGGKNGGCGPLCAMGFMVGGKRHRKGCKCSSCKMMKKSQYGGNPGYPIPNGLTGAPWIGGNLGTWPGVAGVQGGNNYFADNLYKGGDPQTSMIYTGANPPFSIGGRRTRRKIQKGGVLSNTIGQDFINLGRQFQYGLGSAYNALQGYAAPANPMPWKGQLPNTAN